MRQGLCRRQLAGVAQPEGAVALAVVLFAAAVGAVEWAKERRSACR